jgi:hypothetical protein
MEDSGILIRADPSTVRIGSKLNLATEDVLRAISKILRSPIEETTAGNYSLKYMNLQLPPISVTEIEEVAGVIDSFEEVDDTCVITKTSYETLVTIESPLRTVYGQLDMLNVGEENSDLAYRVGRPSEHYIIYLWLKVKELDNVPLPNLLRHPAGSARQEGVPDSVHSVWDAIRFASIVNTLRIVSKRTQATEDWKDYANAFLFQVSYNFDMSILPDRDLRSVSKAAVRRSLVRRSGRADLDVPRRIYISDLIYHYQLGVFSAGIPMLQYISYYHVAEHWFESVFEDDLVLQVRRKITDPGFSYKRKRDISLLIKLISKAVQLRDDRLIIDELTALRLTLERYVNTDELVSDLQNFDSSLLGYYASNKVEFSGGDTIRFNGDQSEVIKALARRIYKTRNALVHSKDGPKGKYTPFTDDRWLIPEIPLMRFIAEQIIIATSELLE